MDWEKFMSKNKNIIIVFTFITICFKNLYTQYVEEKKNIKSLLIQFAIKVTTFFILFKIISLKNKFSSFGSIIPSSDFLVENTSRIDLNDVVGEEVKSEVMDLVDILLHPMEYKAMGAKTPKGVLMEGPPGTGKTMLAKAISNKAGATMYYVSGSSFNQTFVGVGSNRMIDLFEQANKTKPSIIFIDEIDSIGKKRGSRPGMSNDDRESTLNTMLTLMDGFESNEGVLVIGATNRKSILDSALLRPGRFDRSVSFELPNLKERKLMFDKLLSKMPLNVSSDELFKSKYPDTSCYQDELARLTMGMSGADVAKVCNESIIYTVKNRKKTVDWKALETALDYTILGPEKRMKIISDEQKWVVSYHETGHAMVAYILPHADNPNKVSIVPRGNHMLGFSQNAPKEEKMLHTKEELMAHMKVLIAGRVAEQIQFGRVTTGAQDDLMKLTKSIRDMISRYGMDDTFGKMYVDVDNYRPSDLTLKTIDDRINIIIKEVEIQVKDLITQHMDQFHSIAKTLFNNEVLLEEDIVKIMNKKNISKD